MQVIAVVLVVLVLAYALRALVRAGEDAGRQSALGSLEPKRSRAPRREPDEVLPAAEPGALPVFSVVDVETTGFRSVPDGEDRIVEIAIVRLSADARLVDEYVTLVDPRRRVGATRIHGISASHVRGAPSFADLVGDVGERLVGTALVAHNGPFDMRFLEGEFRSAGIDMPHVPALCTLQLAYAHLDTRCRKLGFLCEELGIPVTEHTALGDARATAALLRYFHLKTGGRLGVPGGAALTPGWTKRQPCGRTHTRAHASTTAPERTSRSESRRRTAAKRGGAEGSVLQALLERLPDEGAASPDEAVYLNQLEKALADLELAGNEAEDLFHVATRLGLGKAQTARLNRSFLSNLIASARADGVVTELEAAGLRRVAELLGIEQRQLEQMVHTAGPAPALTTEAAVNVAPGTSVCFLGSFGRTYDQLADEAGARGLVVRQNITKSVGLVVVGDIGAEPRRQARARSLGIPVIPEARFVQMLADVPADARVANL